MRTPVPSALHGVLLEFTPAFTQPSFANFVFLLVGWVLCTGRHTVSRAIQFGSNGPPDKHFSVFYRFFSRAVWRTDALSSVLLRLVLPLIPGRQLVVLVDDTLSRKCGSQIWGGGMFHDPLLSTYGRGTTRGRTNSFSFGHSWVTMSLWVPLPWNPERGLAVPVMWRLYRTKKRCPAKEYRKRTQIAADMLKILCSSLPLDRQVILVADAEYACKTVVMDLPPNVTFMGPMDMDAALFTLPQRQLHPGPGRPRKKGERLPSPRQLANDRATAWEKMTVTIYGRRVELLVKTQRCLWYTVRKSQLVKMIVTRDPKGHFDDRAFFSSNPDSTAAEIVVTFARRWTQEVMHRNVKQYLGLEDPQNGWWRRPDGQRSTGKVPGPQAHRTRGELAVRHTTPFVFLTYSVIVVWYFRHGSTAADVHRARSMAPWYLDKVEPSFGDMVDALRREIWGFRVSADPSLRTVAPKIIGLLFRSKAAAA